MPTRLSQNTNLPRHLVSTTPSGQAAPRAQDPPIAVLLVDDHPALRAGLRSLLSSEPGIEVLADVAGGEEAYTWYRAHRADVVVMDLSMAGYGGMEALRRILQFDPLARILVYSVHTSEVMLHRALALGALGYVTKGSSVDALITGIRELARGQGYVGPDMVSAMVRKRATPEGGLLEQLSSREFQILILTAQGQAVAECAQALNLSEKTVRNHLTHIKAKLRAADTGALIRVAIRAGLAEA
jgi:two-component system, NarL family, invasion response regulator UvrY